MLAKQQKSDQSSSKKRVQNPISKESNRLTQRYPDMTAVQRARLGPRSLTPSDVRQLQSTIGNRAIGRLLTRSRLSPAVQPTLKVNSVGDKYEQEADRVANEVVTMPAGNGEAAEGRQEPAEITSGKNIQAQPLASSITPLVQRTGAEDPELSASIQRRINSDEEETLAQAKPATAGLKSIQSQIQPAIQRRINSDEEETPAQAKPVTAGQSFEATSDFESRLKETRGSGRQLPSSVRYFMEPRFDSDFSSVRVHTDSNSVQMNRDIDARAFTHGNNIYYGRGQAPSNDELTAHELTHVVQQTGPVQRKDKPRQPAPDLLGGITPMSRILSHLQSKGDASDLKGTSFYHKEIAEFTRKHSTEQIMQKQEKLLPSVNVNIKQTGDRSQIFRACGDSDAAGKITHTTKFHAKDGSADTRKKVGVGEEVKFTTPTAGNWKASKGTPASQNNVKEFNWTAPDRASSPTILFKAGGKQSSVTMKVVEPRRVTATKISEIAYPAGQQGAGMKLSFHYHPMSVSFGNVEAKEVSHAASGISGYYLNHGMPHWHDTGDTFFPIAADNKLMGVDTAATSGYPSPWSKGKFNWNIPNKFKVKTEGGDGKKFTTVTQAFSMAGSSGKTKVTKGGARVERTP